MTTRHKGYIVHLDDDLREDDSRHVIAAIRMIKGVVAVTPAEADVAADVIAVLRRDEQWRRAITDSVDDMSVTPATVRKERP